MFPNAKPTELINQIKKCEAKKRADKKNVKFTEV